MMRKTTISLSLIAATAVACPWHFLSAQETEEDSAASAELEIIDLGQERQAPHRVLITAPQLSPPQAKR